MRSDCPDGSPDGGRNAPETVFMRGGSCILGPGGQVLAGPVYGQEVVLTAEVDLAEIARSKYDFVARKA
ncbi:carbon-nitrogen hydrolase family protein [Stigmatella hybrida]|uniref:hypothetical protein n=1 Tax=Stigmatella hybrida TaxID=394097 RepID=UPI001CDB2E24|nr:hypothetical protein [Stigmatella hybrida]